MGLARDLGTRVASRVRGSADPRVTRVLTEDGELDYKRLWSDYYRTGGISGAGSDFVILKRQDRHRS
jgi:hypothetical protein